MEPDYVVERELARGGMGVVFLGRDVELDRPVAIKVLPPELATVTAAQRLRREAHLLANLSHSHIVPVHKAGEADGLFYYVMDYVDGETLEERLSTGPLPRKQVLKLGRDVLDALEAMHERNIVHRDIKPGNLFLVGDRTLVADFGIAKPGGESDDTVTDEGSTIGTPGYMAPEQMEGQEASPVTDMYAVGMVLFEALTGRRWSRMKPDWSGFPRGLIGPGIGRVIRRALAVDPEDRWPDARIFRHRLWRIRLYEYWLRAVGLTVGGMAFGALVMALLRPPGAGGGAPGGLTVRVAAFQQSGGAEDRPRLADSVTASLKRNLSGSPDFRVLGPDESGATGPTVLLRGAAIVAGKHLTLEVRSEGLLGLRRPVHARVEGELAHWEALTDTLAYETLSDLWGESSPLRRWLPRAALPGTTRGFTAWLAAEQLFNEARWEEADDAYRAAVEIDSTCWLCSWRITEVERQLSKPLPAQVHVRRAFEQIGRFPEHYRPLIVLRTLPVSARLDTLNAATANWRDFYYPWFLKGDELFHRGPLFGRLRRESAAAFLEAARLRPEFASTWEHLAWVRIAEGDAEGAQRALDSLTSRPHPGDYTAFIQLAFQYRFESPEVASGVAKTVLQDARVMAMRNLVSGPRLMPTFEAFDGAIGLGGLFTEIPGRPDLALSGLLAQLFGHFAMGEVRFARDRAREIGREFPEADWLPLFAAQLDAGLYLFDSPQGNADPREVLNALRRYAARGTGPAAQQRRAAWIAALLASRVGDEPAARAFRDRVASDSVARPLTIVLQADSLAGQGEFDRALALADSLRQWEAAESAPGPFFRTVSHLLRARWYEDTGNLEAARRELRWHESWDGGAPTDAPAVQEVDWAFGTIARWRRARLLDRIGETGVEACATYGAVARLWARGDGVYAVRADAARRRFAALDCASVEP